MQNVQNVNQFEPENKCPDCVFMRLELESGRIEGLLKKEVKSLNLFLTLNFNWQEEEIKGGTIRFGVKKGTLKITLNNCTSAYKSRKFVKKLESDIEVETVIKDANEHKISPSISISLKEILKGQMGLESKHNREESHKFKTTVCQISAKGSENKPTWDFVVEDGHPCLIGGIVGETLAELEITDNPCMIEAGFATSSKNISVENVDGIVLKNLSQNKRKTLEEILIKKFVLNSKTQPYLSKQELRHG
ncbi:hypothetical protein NG799_21715 [Laspinema sp. D1]|uniref:Uncharacterized protein n=1 Tax=Laspinema palackyanum D2a TaxID=2953684 RepID=A0ABT2MZX0_9CYAN|nr:hypothetical protein [Laspinema sp. D2a]